MITFLEQVKEKINKKLNPEHVLLIDKDQQLCGLISATDIARALQVPININEKAHTFKEIFEVVFAQIEKIG